MKLPAGKYIISDPCYVIDREDYDRLLLETNYFGLESPISGGVFLDKKSNKEFAVFSTKYGDGAYQSNIGTTLWVDAGCIGCIPLEMIKDLEEVDADASNIIDYSTEFEVGYDDGLIIFGQIQIDTDPKEDFDFSDFD